MAPIRNNDGDDACLAARLPANQGRQGNVKENPLRAFFLLSVLSHKNSYISYLTKEDIRYPRTFVS